MVEIRTLSLTLSPTIFVRIARLLSLFLLKLIVSTFDHASYL